MGLSGANLRSLSSVCWGILAATLALSGGKGSNGSEACRKLYSCHGRGSIKQKVNGLRQLQRYPTCERVENLEKELLTWKLLVQQFGATMDETHAFVLICGFTPTHLEDELIRQNISPFEPALDFVDETLARLNGDRLADFEKKDGSNPQ